MTLPVKRVAPVHTTPPQGGFLDNGKNANEERCTSLYGKISTSYLRSHYRVCADTPPWLGQNRLGLKFMPGGVRVNTVSGYP